MIVYFRSCFIEMLSGFFELFSEAVDFSLALEYNIY